LSEISLKMDECRTKHKAKCYSVHIIDINDNVQLQYGVIYLLKIVISYSFFDNAM